MSEEEIKLEYQESKEKLHRLNDEIIKQIAKLIDDNNIQLGFPIIGRVKELDSILNKHTSGTFKLKKTITELQDLVGFRIILLFSSDINNIVKLIEEKLTLERTYDTRDRLEDDQFGYSSVHCIIRVPETWLEVPMFCDFEGLKIEVQIRTLSQHTWAASSHLIDYKKVMPKSMKRSVSRVSALLETVDLEFERLLAEKIAFEKADGMDLDKDLLTEQKLIEILDSNLPIQNKRGNEVFSGVVESLRKIGIDSITELIEIINNHKNEALIFEKRISREIINNDSDAEHIVFDNIKYPKSNLENKDEGYVFYNQLGLLSVILKINKKKQSQNVHIDAK